ncbi:DMT family transporter [Aquirufa rosea]|uniref:DMT family transporter n=1 Tax=Aquirufa rosea TaxID=2509241 RepID=A0A4V1M5F0_9BACT|nr:DMT family transporter [Aquirufa rosea]RXK48906.1 DMT family transporter [Aquirufa rosea]
MKQAPRLLDYLKIHFIVILYAFTAILGNATQANALSIVFFRCVISSIFLLAILRFQQVNFKVPSKILYQWILNGFFIALHWLLFFGAAKVSTVAMCLAGLSTQTFWTSLLEPWTKKEKIKRVEVFLGVLVIIALLIIFSVEQAQALGLMMGIASGFFGALFSVINGKYTHQYDPRLITVYEMITAGIITGIIWIYGYAVQMPHYLPVNLDWLWISILAIVCTVYAYTETIRLYRVFSVFSINLVITLEPVYGILLAVFIFGSKEIMHSGFYWGTALLVITVMIHPFLTNRNKK